MKKFYAILVVLSLVIISSVAMAEVTVSGSVDIRSLALNNTSDFTSKTGDNQRSTQDRFRVNIDAKNDGVKGRITFENDWEVWGSQTNSTSGTLIGGQKTGVEARPGQSTAANKFGIREGWLDFTIPGAGPAHVKVGHQFLQLGNGWFFRSMKYGSDAWLVGLPGKNTIAFVDVKAAEGTTSAADDVDAYVLLDNFKLDDTNTVGIYFARVHDARNSLFGALGLGSTGTEADMDNIGLWFNGKLGPVKLQAELDVQMGKAKASGGAQDSKFKGSQIVLQANMPLDPASINFTIAQGSGDDPNSTSADLKSYVPILDADPHYTVVYEYFSRTACGLKNTGFCNTTALGIGGGFAITKSISANLDFWMLKATEKVANGAGELTDEIGNEVDLVLKFKLNDNLTWNWQLARLMAGKMYDGAVNKAEDADAVQGVLSYKF